MMTAFVQHADLQIKKLNRLGSTKNYRICDEHPASQDGSYDCIVPGSGGKDSVFVAHELKNKYGMHPLTVTWAPHIYTPWGKKSRRLEFTQVKTTCFGHNGKVHRLLTRLAVDLLFHPFQPFILGQGISATDSRLYEYTVSFLRRT